MSSAGALVALVHFSVGALGALALLLLAARLSGERSSSLPAGPIVVGIACAALAHFFSPWATPFVLALCAAATASELRRDRADREALHREISCDEDAPGPSTHP